MTLTDWAALLLADCSNTNLLGFSDWLELDQDDEELTQAARGVREWMAKLKQLSLEHYPHLPEYTWWMPSLPHGLFGLLENASFHFNEANYPYQKDNAQSQAIAHLTALLDAAQAWARCNPEPLTKGKVRT